METAGRCQSPMTSEEWQWILQDLSLQCHSSSLRLLKRGRGDYMQDPSLQCQWTAEDLESHGRPCRHYWLHLQNQSDVWRSIMTGFPPVAESPTSEVPCQLSHLPPPPPPPKYVLVVCIVMCVYCHELMKLCISVLCLLSGDPARPPHGT